MRISLLLSLVLFSVSLAAAQDPLRLDDGGWQPVYRNGRAYLTAPMTPVRVGVRSNRPSTDATSNQPVQVTVGGATGQAIEASAFVRPIQPARDTLNSLARPTAEAPYVPDPVTPASGFQSRPPASAAGVPTHLSVNANSQRESSRDDASYLPSTSARAGYGASNAAEPSRVGTSPDYADTPPRLPPTPPQWNDPALEVARQSLSTVPPSTVQPAAPQSVYWQGQAPADLPPRLPGGAITQPAPLPSASFPSTSFPSAPLPGSATVAPAAPQTFSSTIPSPTMAPNCDAYAASPYPLASPRIVASPSIAACNGAGLAPMSGPANLAGGPEIRRGLIGQPVLRIPGQPLRNFLRFVTP